MRQDNLQRKSRSEETPKKPSPALLKHGMNGKVSIISKSAPFIQSSSNGARYRPVSSSAPTPLLPLGRPAIVALKYTAPNRQISDDAKQLLLGCFNRDQASWDQFVQRYSGLIYHTIKRTSAFHGTQTPEDFTDDLFQEVFLSLVEDDFFQLRRFRGDRGCTLASWLRMIAARRTIDHLRKLNKTANFSEESLSDEADHESEQASKDDQFRRIAGAMAKLKPRERIIIDFLFRKQLSFHDVASILNLSVGAVYTQKSRILAKLRQTLENSPSL